MEANNDIVEIAVGSFANRGKTCKLQDLTKYLVPQTELFRSMFTLDSSAVECFENNGTIRSYSGTYGIDKITFDIDIKQETGSNLVELTRYFLEELSEMKVEKHWINPWFSGTGFHIDIPNLFGLAPTKETPYIISRTIKAMFNGLADNIYDRGRLIRVGYSYNSKSGLYKTPIKISEIFNLSYEEIKDLSKQYVRVDYKHEKLPHVEPIWQENLVYTDPKQIYVPENNTNKLNSHVTCVQKMYNTKSSKLQGHRHTTMLRMISAWKRNGIPYEGSLYLAKLWAPNMDSTETKRKVDDIYRWHHNGYGCQDEIMEKYCDSICKFYRSKDYGLEIKSAQEMSIELREYLNKDLNSSSFDLNKIFRLGTPYMIHAGELVTVMGDTKLGKTAFVQNIVVKLKDMKALYMSLETQSSLIHRRNLQIAHGVSKDDVLDVMKNGTDDEIESFNESVSHIHVRTATAEIKTVKEIVAEVQPKILVIDTMDELQVEYVNDALVKTSKIISGLKQLAQNKNIIIIGISHISKTASYEGKLNRHSAKGDSSIEQKSDKLIGIEAPVEGSPARLVESIVARDENNFRIPMRFNTLTFRYEQNVT